MAIRTVSGCRLPGIFVEALSVIAIEFFLRLRTLVESRCTAAEYYHEERHGHHRPRSQLSITSLRLARSSPSYVRELRLVSQRIGTLHVAEVAMDDSKRHQRRTALGID